MLAVTGSEHGNSYLQLVYRVVGVVVVYRTGMLAVTGQSYTLPLHQLDRPAVSKNYRVLNP